MKGLALPAALLATLASPLLAQDGAPMLVFRNGRTIPLSAVAAQGQNFVVRAAVGNYAAGTVIQEATVSHISGEKPVALAVGTGQFLMGQPREAIKTLEPLVGSLRVAAKISGSYWVESARVLVLAYALEKENAKIDPLVKEISDATPEPGVDPVGRLAKAIGMPVSSGAETRIEALDEQISQSNPVEISAFASFFKGRILEEEKRSAEALQAYLSVGCLYPSGTVLTTSASELQAGLLLAAKKERMEEGVMLVKSAAVGASETAVGAEAKKRLESIGDAADQSEPAEGKEGPAPATDK